MSRLYDRQTSASTGKSFIFYCFFFSPLKTLSLSDVEERTLLSFTSVALLVPLRTPEEVHSAVACMCF